MGIFIKNNADKRLGIERRVFSYILHIPERRSGKERRRSLGRRSGKGFKFPTVFEQVPFFQDWDNT
ncbi:MAG: hypothetical protein SRB2_04586 [Desulfobacteraceae bacterium Eth-SRB2]|nr:MAG: hypothetical protein SRB2_04586 [Desulfobacteraceae bacterium Eth-SRB2]